MMSKKSPQLRFEGFTDDWEERKLGDSIKVMDGDRGSNYPHESDFIENGDTLFLDTGNVTKTGFKFDSVKYITKEKDEQLRAGKLEKNDLVLTSRGTLGNIGFYDELIYKLHPKVRINSAMLILRNTDEQLSYSYLHTLLKGRLISDFMRKNQVGSAQPHITKSEFLKLNLNVPYDIEEQKKIGTFFKQLDDTIALHQRKLDLLKEQKKGYLQKMFPKNGAKVPELRFEGFADDWEQRKLKEVTNHRGGTAIEKYFSDEGKYKVISIGSYGLNSKYVDQKIRATSNEITDGRTVKKGELTMVLNDKTANGTIIGRSLLIEEDDKYVINQRTEIISPSKEFDSSFAYVLLNNSFREKVRKIVQGGTQIYVNYSAVENLKIKLPSLEEQQKIGVFFKSLDDTIALHQRKLDLLKEQKKGFLQKMFI